MAPMDSERIGTSESKFKINWTKLDNPIHFQ